ncbi:MAG: L-histidine N(alpha)-methyltransferase [Bacteroidetes bacterium]|nr:L-histidine N(alpha)-methyltransferase [Bacteroidota bacterium]
MPQKIIQNIPINLVIKNNHFFKSIISEKVVNSAHWFRVADLWHRVSFGYNNPLNFGRVHSEMLLLIEIEKQLISKLKKYPLIFLGIGVGDTEMQIVDMQLKKYFKSNILGIDINKDFLILFQDSLKQREKEISEYKIKYKYINRYFEEISLSDSNFLGSSTQKVICVLGNTIGNYNDTNDIFSIIDRISNSGDLLLVGYQLNNNIKILLQKYKSNHHFLEFISNYLPNKNKSRIKWKINSKNSSIEAWLEDVQIFRSRKFTVQEIINISENYNYITEAYWVDKYQNMCIHLLKKM